MAENHKETEVAGSADDKQIEKSEAIEFKCSVCKDTKSVFAGPCYIPCPDCS